MNKEQLVKFLKNKVKNINNGPFDLEINKRSSREAINGSLGVNNQYSARIKQLEYATMDSYDNLYPEIVNDVDTTKDQFKLLVDDIISEVDLLDEAEFSTGVNAGGKTLEEITIILHKYLNGSQIEKLKKSAMKKNKSTTFSEIVEHLRELDGESSLKMLADILNNDEIWDHF